MSGGRVIKGNYLIEKFTGKGGWSYIEVPGVKADSRAWFGEVGVSGRIDDYQFSGRKLLPMGNGRLFLPINAQIRKKILKEAGNTVELELQLDDLADVTTEDIMACFDVEPPHVYQNFLKLSESERKAHLNYIKEAKTDEGKVQRILKMMNSLSCDDAL
jgi:hypothetical protein